MGYLEKRPSRFKKNGRMGREDLEEIIKKLQEEEGKEGTEETIAGARISEQEAVKEAMKEGLLQPHGIPSNSKQDRIFRILCKNPNGLNNQITGNLKLGKAIDIKDKLDADKCYFVNTGSISTTGTTRTTSSKCSSAKWHVEQLLLTTSIRMLGGFMKEGRGWYHLATQWDSLQR
jgi:hypothetical protein